ncbi:Coenzyme F420 hydrogenase/dehydrogenase, beta subunit C-terminal domain [Clostridium botulinum]|uniref:Coenzyme F420 hydrogenase/dehydrogenase, beta subunit C-terminal domain n=1 Tax=Clostridium botulinum TaxID=1491 RepID=UPI000773239A|nr:Coenzyme F420 hydrogenase/dehydrogenase, beta subunit C-terminal domain [Clostridium botulinum]MBY6931418.1 Coenzyme F420 hydrogenase/dehydrogenase, beta subunit C-terminal domain [Clostridium botulinum]NFG21517.1 4Fe-4S dicluster domain-containing protein [Clostridium botulinum]NFO58344.1 4Fe-4S dicluster domain-containing protein [Clostridium botulinum]NFO80523.1 4Fe-4S dicluster domain-containing protein [Clostridium botulinum]HBJ1647389.1 Coenzyme F420 hydrogenase/dehydrogenase, beta su
MIDNIKKSDCTGCKMCGDICPVNAISFKEDECGFWYPSVEVEKCIKCNKCVIHCPSLNSKFYKEKNQPKVYAAWSKNEKTRISSTSGGAFYEIGKWFIEQGGVVAGCSYGDDWKSAFHMIAKNFEGLDRIKGSKYFQSDTAGIYKEVKKHLDLGKKVLFVGTPCQNVAMKSFLNKEYTNLFYMDFICRSINSPLAFHEYISELEREYKSKVIEVQLKNKKNGWESLASRVRFENGQESIKDKNVDWWVQGFINYDLYTRESCYNCHYKVLPRVIADITIGDFWGIKEQSNEEMFKGISVLLINTLRGKDLFENIYMKFVLSEHSLEEVIAGNPALLKNPIRTFRQDKFFKLIKTCSFSESVKKCVTLTMKEKCIRKIKGLIQRIKKVVQV